VLDIDGTITNGERLLSIKAVNAIREAEKAGIPVMLASGNILPVTQTLGTFIGISGPIIAEDGGVVHRTGRGLRPHLNASREKALRGYNALRKEFGLEALLNDNWRLSEVAIWPIEDIDTLRKRAAEYGLSVQDAHFSFHLIEKGVNKFTGVIKALELFYPELGPENVMAIGDAENDLEMIQGCSIGATVDSAKEEVKRCADIVSPRPYGEGTALLIRRVIEVRGTPKSI